MKFMNYGCFLESEGDDGPLSNSVMSLLIFRLFVILFLLNLNASWKIGELHRTVINCHGENFGCFPFNFLPRPRLRFEIADRSLRNPQLLFISLFYTRVDSREIKIANVHVLVNERVSFSRGEKQAWLFRRNLLKPRKCTCRNFHEEMRRFRISLETFHIVLLFILYDGFLATV